MFAFERLTKQAFELMHPFSLLSALCLACTCDSSSVGYQEWSIDVNNHTSNNNFYYYWDKTVGSGHAALLLRQDWRKYMKEAKKNINFSYVRYHGTLDDDVGSVNIDSSTGEISYSFINIDSIFSYLLSINMKPYIELSFMPSALASDTSETKCHYDAIVSPPSSYQDWYKLIYALVKHLCDYFGVEEVRQWRFEMWNEPNDKFFSGNYTDYLNLYNATAHAIKNVDNKLQIGGPTTNHFQWIDQLLSDCIKKNIPIDFVVTHAYPNSGKINDINTWKNELQTLGIDIVKQYNDKYNLSLPFVISEYNSGCCYGSAYDNGKFWNDDNYFASSFLIFWAKHMQSLFWNNTLNNINNYKNTNKDTFNPIFEWMSYWSVSDVFEEQGFNSNEFNNLYGIQTIRGIKKPAFRAFEMLHKFGSNVEYESVLIKDEQPINEKGLQFDNKTNSTLQVYCLKNQFMDNHYSIFIANWNNYGFNITDENITINVKNSMGDNIMLLNKATLYRIDVNNTNPFAKWLDINSPQYPTIDELDSLNRSSQLAPLPIDFAQKDNQTVQFNLLMPIYGSALIDLQY